MKDYLNKEAEKYRNISNSEAQKLRVAFKAACQVTRSMFGKNAFKRFYKGSEKDHSGYWEPKKFNASLYDIVMYTFAREDRNILQQNLDSIREALIYLMTENQEFIESIELSTSSAQAITKKGASSHAIPPTVAGFMFVGLPRRFTSGSCPAGSAF